MYTHLPAVMTIVATPTQQQKPPAQQLHGQASRVQPPLPDQAITNRKNSHFKEVEVKMDGRPNIIRTHSKNINTNSEWLIWGGNALGKGS